MLNKFETNNDASWWEKDKEEKEEALLTSQKPFKMIIELFLAFTI